jgi:hypothetical protein
LILNRTLFFSFQLQKKVWNIGIKVYKDNSKVDKLMIVEEKPWQEDYNLEAPLGGPTFVISL